MTLAETLMNVWRSVLVEGQTAVDAGGTKSPVKKTRSSRLRIVEFSYRLHRITGIEQNPQTRSRWAELARQGKRIMQFSLRGTYFANVSEGELKAYPAWKTLGLPD